MKKTHWIRGALAGLALLAMLTGCAKQSEVGKENEAPPDRTETATADVDDLAAVATLEAALQREREERYISESAYKAEIKRLEDRLEALGSVAASTDGAPEELTFRYRVENGGAVITKYDGNATLLTIPDELDGYPVTSIGERAFEGSEVVAVTLPEGLVSVGWFAFYDCRSLLNVTFPVSVSSIGYAVFDGCAKVTLCCPEGSYAERYARSYGIPCACT